MKSFIPRMAVILLLFSSLSSFADTNIQGTVRVRTTTAQPATPAFTHHPGWASFYPKGQTDAVIARINEEARFELPRPSQKGTVILNFDQMETPPIIIHNWPSSRDNYDIVMTPDYAVYPEGYPEVWDKQYRKRAITFWQTFEAKSRYLFGATTFDATKVVWWGNKVRFSVQKDNIEGDAYRIHADDGQGYSDFISAQHTDYSYPRGGWRPGDILLQPGRQYALRIQGYRSHGNESFDAHLFIPPDTGNGYAKGAAFNADRSPLNGDLCMFLWGDSGGQIIEHQIRSEEWEIFIPKRPPVTRWGESFLNHGRSLAGVTFWSGNPGSTEVTCIVKVRKDGPQGEIIGLPKTLKALDSPDRLTIRYADWPGQLPDHDSWYKPPYRIYQSAYAPGEVPLIPGEHYYIDIEASAPLMLFADGDIDHNGYAYYNGEKIDLETQKETFHSLRWNLAMPIVTWQHPDGKPNRYAAQEVLPDDDGNLILNGGAEAGDFRGWKLIGEPAVNPDHEFPDPWHYLGANHFGFRIENAAGEAGQYQTLSGVIPGATYEASVWACHADGTDEAVELLWADGSFGKTEHLLARTDPAPKRQWLQYSGRFTPTGRKITIILRYKHTAPTGVATLHADEIKLVRVRD